MNFTIDYSILTSVFTYYILFAGFIVVSAYVIKLLRGL